jgi:cell division protein FtsZ
VLDEKMKDEVKITVIATGFKDQMPERRARMLNVDEAAVVSVPVMATEIWMREPEPVAAAKPSAPARPRFLSEDEEPAQEDAPVFVSSGSASTLNKVIEEPEPELVAASFVMRPKFAELADVPAPLPRDFTANFASGTLASSDEAPQPLQHAGMRVSESSEEENDLDVPAFMRRLQF